MNTPMERNTPRDKVVNHDSTQVTSGGLYYVVVNRSEVDQVVDFLEELRGKSSADSSTSDSSINRRRRSREKHPSLSVTGSEDPFYEWDETVFGFVAMALVHRILEDTPLAPCDNVKNIMDNLTERLMTEIDTSDIVIRPTGSNVVPMVKAVHKKLRKISGGKRVLGILLLTQDPQLSDQIVGIIRRYLRTPQQSGFKRFVNAVTKPFTACFSGSSH